MTKTSNPEFRARLDSEVKNALDNAIDKSGLNKTEFLTAMVELYNAIDNKGLDMNAAIKKIESETTTVIKRGINDIEFANWKVKLFKHNEDSAQEWKVFITQNLFLHIIGGNVNSLSKLYKENQDEILQHNNDMNVVMNNNRKLSIKINDETTFKTVAEWLKATL